jgi:hypothetical protein
MIEGGERIGGRRRDVATVMNDRLVKTALAGNHPPRTDDLPVASPSD